MYAFRSASNALMILLFPLMAVLSACGGDSGGNNTDPGPGVAQPDAQGCTEGFLGCECIGGTACFPGSDWVCLDGTCQEPECLVGTENCACFSNNTCDNDLEGNPMLCNGGLCERMGCDAGTMGCACAEGGLCEEGLACVVMGGDLVCSPSECKAGAEGCPCGDGRFCEVGLACAQNTCITPNCVPGTPDCWCDQGLGCQDGFQCNGETERCEIIPCTPGSFGCGCDNGACMGENAFCDNEGICQEASCVAGQEGCPCDQGDTCAVSELGDRLFCEGGRCRSEVCAPGDVGCACIDGFACADGATCEGGACIPTDCTPGSANCTCGAGSCQPGLRCRSDDLCVDATGFPSGPCFQDGTCHRGGRCANDVCVRCQLGAPGCACDDADSCFNGVVCVAGSCIPEADLPPQLPENPQCFTPCEESDVLDGEFVNCNSNGLIDGCIGGRTCVDGQCLLPDEEARTCLIERGCPFWQTCIGGRCYSECNTNNDCTDGKSCHNYVCRVPCDTTNNVCQSGYHCVTVDAENGFCVPQPEDSNEPPVRQVIGDFELSVANVEMNNTAVTTSFQIRNNSPTFQTFTVRKMDHQVFFADGTGERAVRARDGLIEGCDPNGDVPCFCTENVDCIDDGYRCDEGACRPSICVEGICPMTWIGMGAGRGEPFLTETLEVGIDAGAGVTVTLDNAGDSSAVRWQGRLEVANPTLGKQDFNILYNEVPEGQWSGEMVYLAQFGTGQMDAWLALPNPPQGSRPNEWAGTRNDDRVFSAIKNALIQRWAGFRFGRISFDEMQAVFTAIQTGSWQYANVQRACEGLGEACYLYDISEAGVAPLSSSLASEPVPTGVVEMPFAMNLRIPDPNDPSLMTGRIESSKALQYSGQPSVSLRFAQDPTQCSLQVQGSCVVFMDNFEAEVIQGGRYHSAPDDIDCVADRPGDGYALAREPWLVPGFLGDAHYDTPTDTFYRYECRDSFLPFVAPDPNDQALFAPLNQSLTASNPIPDGRKRRRTLRMLDGALINQSKMVIFFEERFESFLGATDTEGFSAYGFMILQRRPGNLDPSDENANDIPDVYEGSVTTDERTEPTDILAPTCSESLLAQLDGVDAINAGTAPDIVDLLIDGTRRTNLVTITSNSDEQVHYLCEDTGLIDGGSQHNTPNGRFDALPNNNTCVGFANNNVCEDGGAGSAFGQCALGTDTADCGARQNSELNRRVSCPAGSKVTYFTISRGNLTQAQAAALPCQQDGTCQIQLTEWQNTPGFILQEDPVFRCADPERVYCDIDREDMRLGKVFFARDQPAAAFTPLQMLIDQAFRYKTRFQNRDGQGVGFAPEICLPNSDLRPYCYDPEQIAEVQARIDCLLHIHRNYYDVLDTPQNIASRTLLDDYLERNFSFDVERRRDNTTVTHDGFERQFSQLIIMLGDDAFTKAFASRFDLAQVNTAAFEGALFEEDGINLSGAVGFEMVSLYKAAQYYQMVLDRFYEQSPLMWEAIGQSGARNFITPDTVALYFDRVIRASTQKARAWGEIAKRYQNLGRPDLARNVAERAYTSTYLESVVMSRMMLRTLEETVVQSRPQIAKAVEDAQRTYASSLLDMQNVHSDIEDNITIFGFDPDYIPLPAMDNADFRQSNAVEVLLLRARNKILFAREREDLALNSNREFETDQAQFQAELTQIRNNFEGQLGDLCGTFVINENDNDPNNDRVFPAIRKYAHLDPITTLMGEPCGLRGNGQIHDALAAFTDLELEARALTTSYRNVIAEVEIERQRVSNQCREILTLADAVFNQQQQVANIQFEIGTARNIIGRLQTVQNIAGQVTSMANCNVEGCALGGTALLGYLATMGVTEGAIALAEVSINLRERRIAELERESVRWQTQNECDLAKVESEARTKTMLLRLKELEIEFLRLEHRMQLAVSELERLRNQAKRLQTEQAETEALTINVQAAHNNPNVRIYKNDAIINAEIAFDDAIREVYKLTKVFEYFTSQSYERKNDLFLIRMVARGDKNLENYITELENAFFEFEEFFGNPATRVHIVSLKNDIFAIPHVDEEGKALSGSERIALMRDRLTDVNLLDKNGYLTIPFSTNLGQISPLTRNHKISYIEVDFFGNDMGDFLGRAYVRQRGTGVIHALDDSRQFHRFDERTAVVNTIFNGHRQFDNASLYQNFRLRDRPFVNTNWELIINQRDELINQDINLVSLDDVRIYVFYTDFTVF